MSARVCVDKAVHQPLEISCVRSRKLETSNPKVGITQAATINNSSNWAAREEGLKYFFIVGPLRYGNDGY